MTKKVKEIVYFILEKGSIKGEDHKQWVLDQVLRMITTEDEYKEAIKTFEEEDADGFPVYEWSIGKEF